mgnify:FL=1
MQYFGCKTEKDYKNKAEACLKGIDKIKDDISKTKSKKKRAELALAYAPDIAVLEKTYRICRSAYDVLFFAYEYFSDDRNPENDSNLIPAGCSPENAPDVHKELCLMLDGIAWDNHSGKVCYSMPRGHAKSTFVSNVFPIHQCYFDCATDGGRKYILIISETEDLSTKFVEYINSQLKFNMKLREDLGVIMNESKFDNKKDTGMEFVTTKGTMVRAAGMGKALRGARNGAYRPDLVILDDLESMANTNTKELREKNLHWYNSVIEPIGVEGRTAFLYVGTLVHGNGLLPDILTRIDYESRKYAAIVQEPDNMELWMHYCEILDDKTDEEREAKADAFYEENREEMDKGWKTLWSRWTYSALMKKKSTLGTKAFNSEYMNIAYDPDSQIFNEDNIIFFDDRDLIDQWGRRIPLDIYGFWDLAVGKGNKRDDYNAVVIIGRDKLTGVMYVLDAWSAKVPAHKALAVAEQKIAEWQPRLFGVETIQMQYEFYRQLQENIMKHGLYSTRLKACNPKAKKEDRIQILEPLFETGYLRLKRSQRLLLEQLLVFPQGEHDDLPDALASAVDLAGKTRQRTHYIKPEGW